MSLARLLLEKRGVRNKFHAPKLTVRQIVAWARDHHVRTGKWPTQLSGPIPEAPGETWSGVQAALHRGYRGIGGSGMTLRQLLAENFGVRHYWRLPHLRPRQIVAWAAAHHRRTGKWPTKASGPIPEAPGETWRGVDSALVSGFRGMPGDGSLFRLLSQHFSVRRNQHLPPLTIAQVRRWASDHLARCGTLPTSNSGSISGSEGETWSALNHALRHGWRGLPCRCSLPQFLQKHFAKKHLPRKGRPSRHARQDNRTG
jgi:hypothetical protein